MHAVLKNGRVPEWPNGADCKSAVFRLRWFESIRAHTHFPVRHWRCGLKREFDNAEVAQLIEHQPSKLRVASLSLVFRSKIIFCQCSSVVEHFLGKEEVTGSNPVIGSLIAKRNTTPTVRCHCRGVSLKRKNGVCEVGLRAIAVLLQECRSLTGRDFLRKQFCGDSISFYRKTRM